MITITDVKFPKFIEWSEVPKGSSLYADMIRNRVVLTGTDANDTAQHIHEFMDTVYEACQKGCQGSFSLDREVYDNDSGFTLTIFFEDPGDKAAFVNEALVSIRIVA